VDKDLPAPIGDCALTVTTRSKATTVSGGASLELDIAVEIMPRGGDLILFGLTIPSWNCSPSATTETHSLYHARLVQSGSAGHPRRSPFSESPTIHSEAGDVFLEVALGRLPHVRKANQDWQLPEAELCSVLYRLRYA